MKNYHRVIPRDLFNEAKLLKCIGRLSLMELDRMLPCKMVIVHDEKPFDIQLLDEGSLYIRNIEIFIKDHPAAFMFKTTYNSKAIYPLFCQHEDVDYPVLDDKGQFTEEFIEFTKTL